MRLCSLADELALQVHSLGTCDRKPLSVTLFRLRSEPVISLFRRNLGWPAFDRMCEETVPDYRSA